MKKLIIAAVLSLSVLPVLTQASTEINRSHQCELLHLGSISVSGGTIDELSSKLAVKADNSGAYYFRITSLNTNARGFATATLYDNARSLSGN